MTNNDWICLPERGIFPTWFEFPPPVLPVPELMEEFELLRGDTLLMSASVIPGGGGDERSWRKWCL